MIFIDKEKIKQGLSSNYSIIKVFDCVDSTNESIKMKEYFYPNSLIISKDQGKGKGTNGRSFYCEKNKGIYASCVIEPEKTSHAPTLLPIVMGLSLVNVLKKYGINAHVKWVNDILMDSKKVAGILCEQGYNHPLMVVGIGINVYPMNFPDDIVHQATTLQQHTQQLLDINQIVVDLFLEFNKQLFAKSQQIIDEYCLYNKLMNQRIMFISNQQTLQGVVKTIDHTGALIVSHNSIDHRIVSSKQIINY